MRGFFGGAVGYRPNAGMVLIATSPATRQITALTATVQRANLSHFIGHLTFQPPL